ncbi:hypothetical protein [Labrys monachus]|uniref:Uncharacterized protein n=1 Tax=Labrys monachus TaxID=217067 RepID=A0ABU0F994_9HYPH|nr:hypothetical protein [Labrys monachus]MDQ0390719.1 hypothetical protein [Labrys monachus]
MATELRMAFDSPDQQKISEELAGKEVVCHGSVTQEGWSMLGVGQKYLMIVNPVCEPK